MPEKVKVKEQVKVERSIRLETNGIRASIRKDGGVSIKDKKSVERREMGFVDIDLRNVEQLSELITIAEALRKKMT